MKWIKAKDKLPEEYKSIPIKIGNKYGYAFYDPDGLFHSHTGHIGKEPPQFKIDIVEWLEESEPSFGLEDMAMVVGHMAEHIDDYWNDPEGTVDGDVYHRIYKDYFKSKYNLDL